MRTVTIAVVLLAVASASAETPAGKDAGASAKAALAKLDEAYNAHDAKAFEAMLDPGFVMAGPYISSQPEDVDAAKADLEKQLAGGRRMTRESTNLKTDHDGDTAWFVSESIFVPKVPPGALPVRRHMHQTGVLVRHGKDWKLALLSMSILQLDPPAPVAPPGSPTAPTKK